MFLKKLLSITLFVASMSVYSSNQQQNTNNSNATTPNTTVLTSEQMTSEQFNRTFPHSRLNRLLGRGIIPGFEIQQVPGTETQYFTNQPAPQNQNQNQ